MNGRMNGATKLCSALLVAGALTLTAACGGGDSGGGDGTTTLRVAWWGNDTRQAITEEVLDLFMEKNEDIKVEMEYSDWDNYYDRLTTQMASGDAPDVFSTEIRRMGEFGTRNALADLDGLVDMSGLDPQLLQSGQLEGTQYAIPTGVNAFIIAANKTVLDEAGIELPDDTTWTWDDYRDFAAEVTAATGDGTYGTQLSFNDAYLNIYAQQHGEIFYGEDGKIGMSEEVIADWYSFQQDLIDAKASPDASRSAELGSTGVEASLVATNKGAFGMWWSNQLNAITTGSGSEIVLLRMPKDADAVSGGHFLQPNMFWSVAASSGKKEAAGQLVDFLVNDPEAAAIIGSDRGLPRNAAVLEEIRAGLPETDQASLEFIGALADELNDPPKANPNGAGEMPAMLERYGQEVVFGRMTPQEAASGFISEANSVLSK
ncbi:ABC transporter substrate-binding protein [Streptomyces xiamenensis]